MNHFDDTDYNEYSEKHLDKYLSMIPPEAQEQSHYRMGLAGKIADALKAKGWKNQDLANALHIKSPSLISKWLSGTHNFTVDTLVLIQRVLNIQLLNIEEDPATAAKLAEIAVPNPWINATKETNPLHQKQTASKKNNRSAVVTVHYK